MHDAGGASAAAPLCPPAAAGRQLLSALRRASIVQAPHARVPFASPVAAGGRLALTFGNLMGVTSRRLRSTPEPNRRNRPG